MNYYVILNDGETFTNLEGCQIVGIDAADEAALDDALDGGGDGRDIVTLGSEIYDWTDIYHKLGLHE